MIYHYIKLMRPAQWFKNLIIFAPLFAFGYLFNSNALLLTIIGFVIFCLISSAAYVINDIIDAKADRAHPTKKHRPIASGQISESKAVIFAVLLIAITTFLTSILLNYVRTLFVALVLALFVLTLLYSIYFKNKPILDLFFVAFNFAMRCAAGFLTIHQHGSPWFLLTIFFLSLFWLLGKRKVELDILGNSAVSHKRIYNFYKKDMIYGLINITIMLMIVSYGLVTFFDLSGGWVTTLTVPIACFMAFRYLFFIYTENKIAAHPEQFFKDKQMMGALVIWILILFCFVYLTKLGINPIDHGAQLLRALI